MTYSEYRYSFSTAEEFMQAFGKLSEKEAKELISTIEGSATIKASAFTTWTKAKKLYDQNGAEAIKQFATKWLDRFNDPDVQYIELVDHWMADECRSLGFVMDCGQAFCKDYQVAFNDCDALNNVIGRITDVSLLGSAIFSKWRYYNHWAYSGSEILEPENRKWFILALERLKTLSEKALD